MRSLLVLFGILAPILGSAVEKRFCAADSCNLFVTFFDQEPDIPPNAPSRRADCSSFLLTTVTPTSYATTFLDYTVTVDQTLVNRQASEIAFTTVHVMPSYAVLACNSPEDYASVCSCWGISGSRATAPAVTSTSTYYWAVLRTASNDPPATTPMPSNNTTITTITPIITSTG